MKGWNLSRQAALLFCLGVLLLGTAATWSRCCPNRATMPQGIRVKGRYCKVWAQCEEDAPGPVAVYLEDEDGNAVPGCGRRLLQPGENAAFYFTQPTGSRGRYFLRARAQGGRAAIRYGAESYNTLEEAGPEAAHWPVGTKGSAS